MNQQSPITAVDSPDHKYELLCDYLARPLAHALIMRLLWRTELDALEAELVGSTRVRPDLEIVATTQASRRIKRTEDHYLDEDPRFVQVEAKRGCGPTMDEGASTARVDLYMRGGLAFRYRTLTTHVDRPVNAAPPYWKGKITVFEGAPEVTYEDARIAFEVGVFVVTRFASLPSIAKYAREFRRRAPAIRLVMVWGAAPLSMPIEFAAEAELPLLLPGSLFDAYCAHRASGCPAHR